MQTPEMFTPQGGEDHGAVQTPLGALTGSSSAAGSSPQLLSAPTHDTTRSSGPATCSTPCSPSTPLGRAGISSPSHFPPPPSLIESPRDHHPLPQQQLPAPLAQQRGPAPAGNPAGSPGAMRAVAARLERIHSSQQLKALGTLALPGEPAAGEPGAAAPPAVSPPAPQEECPSFLEAAVDAASPREAEEMAAEELVEEAQAAAAAAPLEPALVGTSLQQWRAANPQATGVLACGATGLQDAHVAQLGPHFQRLSLAGQWYAPLTSAALAPLTGLRRLSLAACNQPALCDAALAPLVHLQELCLAGCDQATLTDAALRPLVSLRELSLYACTQLTSAVLAPFAGSGPGGAGSPLRVLCIARCPGMANAAIAQLTGLEALDMRECQGITAEAFAQLGQLRALNMGGAVNRGLGDATFAPLRSLHTLRMAGCTQPTLTSAALQFLTSLTFLDMTGCKQRAMDGPGAFPAGRAFPNLHTLVLRECNTDIIVAATARGLKHCIVLND